MKTEAIKIVTGFAPIPNHPRTPAEYAALGKRLSLLDMPIRTFHTEVDQCWLYELVDQQPKRIEASAGDNPAKNTFAYHVVIHQKFEWLRLAAKVDSGVECFVWLDYGIFHVPGVTQAHIQSFLRRIDPQTLAIPGCWQPVQNPADVRTEYPWWRFCGGLMVVPRRAVLPLRQAVEAAVKWTMNRYGMVDWEVNTLARVEAMGAMPQPFRWYLADHNERMFTEY